MKKNKGIIIALLLITVIGITAFLLFSNKVKVNEIVINDYISLYVDERKVISIKILPEDAVDKEVIWQSENNDIAIVEDGVVEGKTPGTTKVKVSLTNNKVTSECVIQVLERTVDKIELDKEEVNLTKGNTITLTSIITPNNLYDKKITWTSSDSNIATVDENGMITAVGNGNTEITATVDGRIATCKVNVTTLVSSIELVKKEDVLIVGASETLTYKIEPSDASNKEVTWNSSNPDAISIDNGKIVAKKSGSSKITVTTVDGNKSATYSVKVVGIKNFDIRNEAVIEYLKNPNENTIQSVQKKMCKKGFECHRPAIYSTSLTGDINIYNYKNNRKEFIAKIDSKYINNYLIPNNTYYLEMVSDKQKIEVVKVTGDLRMVYVPNIANVRDLGGWKADGGTVKYGKIYRSASTNDLKSLSEFDGLGIGKVVDLRGNGEIKSTSAVNSIRVKSPIVNYNNDKKVRKAIEEVIKGIVEQKTSVLFNCAVGRDRTGTIAYIIEGILGVSSTDRGTDYELSFFFTAARPRNYGPFKTLCSRFRYYDMDKYEQERFINWYLSTSSNKEKDLELINDFRKMMIDGNPHTYKLVSGKLTLA